MQDLSHIGFSTSNIVNSCCEFLIENYVPLDGGELPWSTLIDFDGDNPENIENGISGILLFLMEIYDRYRSENVRNVLDSAMDQLDIYCTQKQTHDYGLYTGRTGYILALMYRYSIDENQKYLDRALQSVLGSSEIFRTSAYTSNFLYDGKAGLLLVLLKLYDLMKHPKIKDQMGELMDSLLQGITLSHDGIFWENPYEYSDTVPIGFGDGSSGILYVLQRLHHRFPNENILSQLISSGSDLIASRCGMEAGGSGQSCYRPKWGSDPSFGNRNRFSGDGQPNLTFIGDGWLNGLAGIGLFTDTTKYGYPHKGVKGLDGTFAGFGLMNGMCGKLLCHLQLGESMDVDSNKTLFRAIMEELDKYAPIEIFKSGFLKGTLGCLYGVLKLTQETKTNNVLSPFYHFLDTIDPQKESGTFIRSNLFEILLCKYYPRTTWLIRNIAGGNVFHNALFKRLGLKDITLESLHDRLLQIIGSPFFSEFVEPLNELATIENTKISMYLENRKSAFDLFADQEIRREEITTYLNLANEAFFNLELVASPDFLFVDTQWDWSFWEQAKNKVSSIKALLDSHRRPAFTIILKDTLLDQMDVYIQHDFSKLLNLFKKKSSIKNAIATIDSYIKSLDDASLTMLLANMGMSKLDNYRDFEILYRKVLLTTVKKWLFLGILNVNHE